MHKRYSHTECYDWLVMRSTISDQRLQLCRPDGLRPGAPCVRLGGVASRIGHQVDTSDWNTALYPEDTVELVLGDSEGRHWIAHS